MVLVVVVVVVVVVVIVVLLVVMAVVIVVGGSSYSGRVLWKLIGSCDGGSCSGSNKSLIVVVV